jgi:CRP/FNR family transcriptional regulator
MLGREQFLDLFSLFKRASPEAVTALLTEGSLVGFQAGTLVQIEGRKCEYLDFMLAGEKRVYKASDTGREITLYEVGPGEICILSASCILAATESPVYAQANSAVEMLRLPAESFRRLIAEYEEVRSYLFLEINRTFSAIIGLLREVVFLKLDERLADYLLEKAENNQLAITHQKIADDLGTAREVVSRLLKAFERQGRIVLSRNLIRLTDL